MRDQEQAELPGRGRFERGRDAGTATADHEDEERIPKQ